MKKIITGLFILSFAFMLNSQTKKAGTIIKISGSEITVKNENPQKPFQMGENLRLLTGDESVILRVVFAMQTSAKCTLVSGNIKSLKIGSVVYSGEQQSKNNTALKPLTKLQPVKIESIKLDDFDTFLGFTKGDSIDNIINIFGSPFIKTPTLEMSGFTSKDTLIWWDITEKNHVFLGIVSESANTQKTVSVITISSATKKGDRNYYQDTLKFDTLGYAVVNQQVIKNTIDNIIYTYNLTIPEKTITKFVYPKNNLYIGGLLGVGNISPVIMYTNKGKYNYLVSYNLVRSEINAGVLIKFK